MRRHIPFLLIGATLAYGCDTADKTADLRDFVAMTKASSPGRPLEPIPRPAPYRPAAYEATELRSPFSIAAILRAQAAPPRVDNGIRPNLDRPREELEKYALSSLRMVGTIERDTRLALIKVPDGSVQTIQAGNYIGTDYGKVLKIDEDHIELLEIVQDGNGGWVERRNTLALSE